MDRNKSEFWNPKTIQQLAKEQNVRPVNFDELMKKGRGRKLWRSDKEFEEFLAHLRVKKGQAPLSMLLVDTNVVSFIMRRDTRAVPYMAILHGHTQAISFMTVAELFEGAHRAKWGERRIAIMEDELRNYIVVPSSYAACQYWGRVRSERRRMPISPEDAWIAAVALSIPCPLVTHDAKDFEGISGLKVLSVEP